MGRSRLERQLAALSGPRRWLKDNHLPVGPLSLFPREGPTESTVRAENSDPNDAPLVVTPVAPVSAVAPVPAMPNTFDDADADAPANGGDGDHTPLAAFQAALNAAQREAETQLIAIAEQLWKTAAERHAAELARVAARHTEELRTARDNTIAEVASAVEHVHREEAERRAPELAGLREELERTYAENLQRARTAVMKSFDALTGRAQNV